ncbi:hypothetical protein T439DRAFT_342810 [Meredithblackwellia eburnea MCA 4105]
MAEKRLKRELTDIVKDKESTIGIRLVDDADLMNMIGSFKGPEGTPYEGGEFEVDIKVPPNYPFSPLICKMITKTYHPNISSQTGAICLSTLGKEWSPVMTLRTVLVSLRSLLADPQPNDPQDGEVAKVFLTDPEEAARTARFWTEVYANAKSPTPAPSKPTNSKPLSALELACKNANLSPRNVEKFTEMGFSLDQVVNVLSRLDYRGERVGRVQDDEVMELLFG